MTQPAAVEQVAAVPAVPEYLVNVQTGETLPATVENAAVVIQAARDMKNRLTLVVRDAEAYLTEESRRRGTKTFHVDASTTVSLSGGPTTKYDAEQLRRELLAAGCPADRVGEVVVETVEYTVNRSVLRQLTGANPDYAAAAERASFVEDQAIRAAVKSSATRRRTV